VTVMEVKQDLNQDPSQKLLGKSDPGRNPDETKFGIHNLL
jgi:hypothetical protein